MKFTEQYLQSLGAPLSKTAEERCKEALNNVTSALKGIGYTSNEMRVLQEGSLSFAVEMQRDYSGRKIKMFTQGSYANDTNITKTSDVDIAIVLESTFTMKSPRILLNESIEQVRMRYNFSASNDTVGQLKDDVEDALCRYFGTTYVQRKNKSVKVIGNSVRTDCDTVPAMRDRDYSADTSINEANYVGGIQIVADDGEVIINYPEQHIRNGVKKNSETQYNFKKCVRVVKNIREIMREYGYSISDSITSFGLESLLWNATNGSYNKYPSVLRYTFDEVLINLFERKDYWDTFTEVNGIKKLFITNSIKDSYIIFINDLRRFYEYDIKE